MLRDLEGFLLGWNNGLSVGASDGASEGKSNGLVVPSDVATDLDLNPTLLH